MGEAGFYPLNGGPQTVRPIVGCALLLAAFAGAACSTMKSVTLDQLSVLGPDRAWVTKSDESVVLMYEPKVVGDTLVGYIGAHRGRLPSAGLKELRVQTPAHTRTVLLAVGSAAGLIGFMVVVAGNSQTQPITTVPSGAPGDCEKHPEGPGCNGN
jgi:hypothetical protein